MKINNFKKNIYYIINNIKINNFYLFNGNLYININNIWEYFTIKLVLFIINYKNKSSNYYINYLVLIFKNNRYNIILNNNKNRENFIAFFDLFLSKY